MLATREEKRAWLEKIRQEYLIKTRQRWTYENTPTDASTELLDLVNSKEITTTQEIVDKYNEAEDGAKREVLHQWLERHVDWMMNNLEKRFKAGVMKEWCCLTGIKIRDAESKELVKRVFIALSERQKQDDYRERETRFPLAIMLFRLDPSIFDGDATFLVELAKHMISTTQVRNSCFSHHTYFLDSPKLQMLHMILLLIEKLEPEKMNPDHEEGLYELVMDCVQKIPTAREIFSSLVWEAMLVERSHKIPAEGDPDHRHIFRRLLITGSGCPHLWEPFKNIMIEEMDDAAADKAHQRLVDCYKDPFWTKNKTWYEMLVEHNEGGLLLYKKHKAHDEFIDYYKKLREDQEYMDDAVSRKHLRYGFVRMFTLLALHGPTVFLRESGVDEVYVIALCYLDREKWAVDTELFEGVLYSMHDIHMQGEFVDESTLPVLKELYEFRSRDQQIVLLGWMDNLSFDQKLRELPREYEEGDPGRLFSIIILDITTDENYLEDLPDGIGGASKEVDKSISTIPE